MENTVQDWWGEFNKVPRNPRKGLDEIKGLLARALELTVTLQEGENETVVAVKFPASTKQLSNELQNIYSDLGVGVEAAFQNAILKPPPKGSSTLLSEIRRTVYNAYRATWLHLLETNYVDQSHPEVDKSIREGLNAFRKNTALSRGKHNLPPELELWIQQRYKQLLSECSVIHDIVADCEKQQLSEQDIRNSVFKLVRGKPFAPNVLRKQGGPWSNPWQKDVGIRYTERYQISRAGPVVLHDSTSWKPNQLAISLLAIERQCNYQTIEKKVANPRSPGQVRRKK